MFKEYLRNKCTIESAIKISKNSDHLRVNASDESLHVDQMIGVIEQN